MVEFVFVLLILLAFGIRTSWFQTYAAQKVAAYLSSELGTEISIGKVDIVFFDKLELEEIYVEDVRKDTFLYTKTILAEIEDWGIKGQPFVDVSNLSLNTGKVFLRKYEGDSTLNFQHLIDYFASEDEDTTKSNFRLGVSSISLEEIEFMYEDQNAEKLANGMDFSNIHLYHFSSHFSEFGLLGDSIEVKIDDLHFTDRSGLTLNKLSTEVLYCPETISLEDLRIAFKNTWLYADYFALETPNGAEDWSDFVHKVNFKARLRQTKLSLKDLAYFVPDIWGMNDRIAINNIDVSGPIYGMRLRDVDIRMLDTTMIKGSFDIPDFGQPDVFFHERVEHLRTSIDDIAKLDLSAFLSNEEKMNLLRQYGKADIVEMKEGHLTGFLNDFTVDGDIYSGLGNIHSEAGIQFQQIDGIYHYDGPEGSKDLKEVIVENLDLGAISGNPMLGPVTGYVKVKDGSKGFSMADIDLKFDGHFDRLYLNEYTYSDININNGRFHNEIFDGVIDIADDNLALKYIGSIDLKGDMFFDFKVRIDSAHLETLMAKHDIIQRVEGDFHVRVKGKSLDKINGTLEVAGLRYRENEIHIELDSLAVGFYRHPDSDTLTVRSELLDLDMTGRYDLTEIDKVLMNQLSYIADNLAGSERQHKAKNKFFDLSIDMKDINPILPLVDSSLYIAPHTTLKAEYDLNEKLYAFDLNSEKVGYGEMALFDFKMENHFDSLKGNIFYTAELAQINDSAQVKNFYIDSYIKKNTFLNTIGWMDMTRPQPAMFAFHSEVKEDHEVYSEFDPSFFYLQDRKWIITPKSTLVYNQDKIELNGFKISQEDNYLSLDGIVSKNPQDWLNFKVKDFDLSALNGLLQSSGMELQGILNVDGGVADVYNNMRFKSQSNINNLIINENLVGDLDIRNKWNQGSESVSVNGKLIREGIRTFTFSGNYFVNKETDNIRMNLDFDKTDISFLNAFEDPDLYTNIAGILDGELTVSGELTNPVIRGELDMSNTKVFVPMFNVGYGLSGTIRLDEGEILGDFLKLYDQEGNQGYTNLQVFHDDWGNWSYDISLDLDETTVPKFYVLNTTYKEGDFYYGKAYITGGVNISGFGGKSIIMVDAKTKPGTDLTLPMYGTGELEETSFIQFVAENDSTITMAGAESIERTGLELQLKFNVTKDANVKIVFDPVYEDQITSKGEGKIEVSVDEFNEVKMFGTYTILDGKYAMRMKNIVNKDFTIRNGSYLTWTQSPYDADINIIADFIRLVNMSNIMPNLAEERDRIDEVVGSLVMTEKLMSPALGFDLNAPKTDELGAAAINEVKSNPDMLKKQFFALLMLNKFLPTHGVDGGAGTNAVLGLAENQINAVLGNLSENYKMAADLTDESAKLNMSTQISDRVSIKTSLGVVSDQNQAGIVGDVAVEYRLNDDGSFNMTFFNESNTGSEAEKGPFTQGVGLHYEETFSKAKDFRLLQNFLNVFRKPENRIKVREKKKKDKYRPIPE